MVHQFSGKWISDSTMANLAPRNVFHRQLEKIDLPTVENRNLHILYRKKFNLSKSPKEARIYISADDYYKLYINGRFVAQGPAPSYHFNYNYNVIDVTEYLRTGENLIAVHTLYQGLINRVWQSGDNRHGLILDLSSDENIILSSDESFKTSRHTAYEEMGIVGYDTQFMERYDSRVGEVGFEHPDYDDRYWQNAVLHRYDDHIMTEQTSQMLTFEKKAPVTVGQTDGKIIYDFGSNYVGYLVASARGTSGDTIIIRCAQELTDEGELRYELRANCKYEEEWILSSGDCTLDQFDYKSFRYAELIVPKGVEVYDAYLTVRHHPFELKLPMRAEFANDERLKKIYELCTHTLEYGVQEVIQDCMEREKGFYLGDGCYTALTHMLLSDDDSMVRKLINDAFSTDRICDTLVTCMDCSFMQEIAEYPLMLVYLVLWHYNCTSDKAFLSENYEKVKKLLDAYAKHYEKRGLLRDLDKWCVVEWPKNFQHGYDVEISEGKICHEAHISINSYYIAAIKTANRMAEILGYPPYRDEKPLLTALYTTLYDKEQNLFRDGESTTHVSLVGNVFPFSLGLSPNEKFDERFISMLRENGIHSLSMFCTFPVLMGLATRGRYDLIREALLDEGAWLRILREDGTTTFEGWGKDTKWNTSLFHLTMSYAALFLADTDLEKIF